MPENTIDMNIGNKFPPPLTCCCPSSCVWTTASSNAVSPSFILFDWLQTTQAAMHKTLGGGHWALAGRRWLSRDASVSLRACQCMCVTGQQAQPKRQLQHVFASASRLASESFQPDVSQRSVRQNGRLLVRMFLCICCITLQQVAKEYLNHRGT